MGPWRCRECEIDEDLLRLVPDMKDAGPQAAALLIECRANGPEGLEVNAHDAWRSFPRRELNDWTLTTTSSS